MTSTEGVGETPCNSISTAFSPAIPRSMRRRRAMTTSDALPEAVDVLIVGCGPAGLTLAAQLAAFPEITTANRRAEAGPLLLGQADGDRLPDDGDVRGVRLRRARGRRKPIGSTRRRFWKPDDKERGRHRPQQPHPGRRGRPLGIPARDPEPGAGARLLSRRHAQRPRPGLAPHYSRRLVDLEVAAPPPTALRTIR